MRLMERFKGWGTLRTLPLAGVLLGASLATVASAHTGPVANGIIHACVAGGGALRIIGAAEVCKNNEQALDWNAQGPAGPAGVSGREVVRQATGFSNCSQKTANAQCPAGKVVLGGGYLVGGGAVQNANVTVITNEPSGSDSRWQVIAQVQGLNLDQTAPFEWSLHAVAICANVQ